MSTRVLVTGAAGYIGSHAVLALKAAGHEVAVIDDLSTGRRAALPGDVELVVGDVGVPETLARLITPGRFATIMHFAGSVVVPESVANPLKYYRNNTAASRTLIEACIAARVPTFVFSSTAAIYGIPNQGPVTEDTPTRPISPYGWSKLMTERMLTDVGSATSLRFAALRYFNVAGADLEGRTGQSTPKASHMIKVAVETALGKRPAIQVFGEDYATPDGTCVCDYIHVSDLAQAHVLVMEWLRTEGRTAVLNCGYGRGSSVWQVLDTVDRIAGTTIRRVPSPRREGDPPELVANSERLMGTVAWRPRYDDLGVIVKSALDWERTLSR
ncbi:MAG: UDP-glucose 4-epimerase GalE [Alphaproteobacteria bacterium]|nr:UDP-glucose 4-epimerase GalE [Alphaproteobacteria bacterium]